jgi:hypothetical protein
MLPHFNSNVRVMVQPITSQGLTIIVQDAVHLSEVAPGRKHVFFQTTDRVRSFRGSFERLGNLWLVKAVHTAQGSAWIAANTV